MIFSTWSIGARYKELNCPIWGLNQSWLELTIKATRSQSGKIITLSQIAWSKAACWYFQARRLHHTTMVMLMDFYLFVEFTLHAEALYKFNAIMNNVLTCHRVKMRVTEVSDDVLWKCLTQRISLWYMNIVLYTDQKIGANCHTLQTDVHMDRPLT